MRLRRCRGQSWRAYSDLGLWTGDLGLTIVLVLVRDDELVKADLALSRVADVLQELLHQAAEAGLSHRIEIVLSVAAGLNQSGDPQQGQVMADSRLALAE